MVDGAKVLYDYEMAELFERAIYNGLYVSTMEESMQEMLMPIDPLLDDEQSLTNKIDVIQYGESLAAKATSTADVFVVTVGAPETGQ
ncbi:MAG: hypothetical protein HXS54_05825, partial [Theionarchaea archaeon]|nr:hypothetical protein [Theionarchaea archaeon]